MTINVENVTTTEEEMLPSTDTTTHEEFSLVAKLDLRNCQKIAFVEEVDSQARGDARGIEGTYNIFDASTLSSLKKWKKEKANLAVVATLHIKCENRWKGDIKATVVSPSEELVATFERNKRRALFTKDAETEIPVLLPDKTTFAILKPDMSGKQTEIFICEGNPKVSYKMWFPAWQPQTKWCLFTFLCFLPTFGLGGCIGFYCMVKAGVQHKIDKYEDGEKIKELAGSDKRIVDFEGVSSSEDKFALLALSAFRHADSLSDPPSSN